MISRKIPTGIIFWKDSINAIFAKVFFFGAADLIESPHTNRMRYYQTVFCIQLETEKAQVKIFFFNFWKIFQMFSKILKIRDFQMTGKISFLKIFHNEKILFFDDESFFIPKTGSCCMRHTVCQILKFLMFKNSLLKFERYNMFCRYLCVIINCIF